MPKTAAEILADLDRHFIGPSTGHDPLSNYVPKGYGDWTSAVRPQTKPTPAATPAGDPLWKQLLGSLGGLGSGVTDTIYQDVNRAKGQIGRWTDGKFNWKDDVWKALGTSANMTFQPFREVGNAAKGQWDQWTHGDKGLHYNDIPILGTLNLMNEHNKHGSDILGQTGVKNEGVKKWGGLALDMLLDPTTYLTLGGGSAAKLGARAAGEVAAQQAAKFGVAGSKVADHIPYQVFDKVKADMMAKGIAQPLAERFATKKLSGVQDLINGSRKTARAEGQNALFNFDVPFTNIAKSFGKKPEFLTKLDAKIGSVAVPQAMELLGKLGAHTAADQHALLQRMGIDLGGGGLDNMGTQQFKHLQDQVDTHFGQNLANNGQVKANLAGQMPPVTHTAYQQTTSFPGMFQVGNPITKTTANVTSHAATPHVPAFDQFALDMGGRSKFGDKLGKAGDMFNPRTLGVAGQGIVNESAGHIRQAEGKIYAGMRNADKVVSELQKDTKHFTPDDMKNVEYLLENAYPQGFNQATITQAQRDVAAKLKPIYKEIADAESKLGILQTINKNYAPHAVNRDPALLQRAQKYPTDPVFQKLVAKSSRNQFAKARTSFESFAELDNAIAKLDRAKQQPGLTPDQIAEINDKMDILGKLFSRDPIDSLGKRYAKSIKSRAMKQLQDQLMKDGLLKAGRKAATSPQAAAVAGDFVRLRTAEANALNLKPGMMIHKDILTALKKVDEIFTVDGMNSFVKVLENVTGIIKSLYTTYIPSHYWNNFVGNLFNNSLAGVKPGSYNEARKLMKAVREGKASTAQQKTYQDALENGVLHQGALSDLVETRPNDAMLGKAAHAMYNNKVAKTIRNKVGDPTENLTRLALFLHSKNLYGTTKLAADNVRKYLFNYHETTSADRIARLGIPFWNWMKNNVPLQIEQLMQQPRFYQTYQRLKDANHDGSGEMPGYAQDAYFKFPFLGANGQARDPMLPLNDLNGIMSGNIQDTARFLAGSANPLVKTMFEIPANTNIYTGRPIDFSQAHGGGTDYSAWAKYGLSQLGKTGRTAYDVTSGDTSIIDAIGNMLSPFGKPVPLK